MNRVLKFLMVVPVVVCVSCENMNGKLVKKDKPPVVKEELEHPYTKAKRDSLYKAWQIIKGKKISFAAPPGWGIEKHEEDKSLVLNIIPPEFRKQKDGYVFEIIEVKADKWKFEQAASGVIEYYNKKSGSLPQIMNNLDIRMLGYQAKEFDINVTGEKVILPVKAYMISAGEYYYLLSYVKQAAPNQTLDKIFRSVLRSIVIEE